MRLGGLIEDEDAWRSEERICARICALLIARGMRPDCMDGDRHILKPDWSFELTLPSGLVSIVVANRIECLRWPIEGASGTTFDVFIGNPPDPEQPIRAYVRHTVYHAVMMLKGQSRHRPLAQDAEYPWLSELMKVDPAAMVIRETLPPVQGPDDGGGGSVLVDA